MGIEFCSLHSHSTYSFLDGFGHPEDLVKRAKELGHKTLALTDHGSVSGHPMLEKYAIQEGIKPIFGNEFYFSEDMEGRGNEFRHKYHITVLALNGKGYENLLKLTTLSFQKGFYYKASIDEKALFENQEGLIVLSGCLSGKLQKLLGEGKALEALDFCSRFKAVFGDRFYLETQHYPQFVNTYEQLLDIGKQLSIPAVVTIDNHYLKKDQGMVREILWSIRDRRQFNPENVSEDAALMSGEDVLAYLNVFSPNINWIPYIERTAEIAARFDDFRIRKGTLPKFAVPDGKQAIMFLAELCAKGMERRGLTNLPEYKVRILKELRLIKEKDFADYFLMVADIVNWAKESGILVGPGRGSVGSSLAAYALGITEIDPLKYDLIFERFIDSTRTDLPDIDLDFEDEQRYRVKEYIINKYGATHVVQLGTFAAFKGKNSLEEVGKSFSIPKSAVEEVKKYLVERSGGDQRAELSILDTFTLSERAREVSEQYPDILNASKLEGQLKHQSSHAAGVLVSNEPIDEIIAFYRNKEDSDAGVASVDYDGAKYLGLVKLDLLGLTELTMIRKIFEANGLSVRDVYNIPVDDTKTLEAFGRTDVLGVFQAEGESTKSIFRQMNTTNLSHVVDAIGLSKPGPSHSGSASAYLIKKNGGVAEGFDSHPLLDNITKPTYGQILYQEQVMRILNDMGKFGITEANTLRDLISKSKGEEKFETFWPNFLSGSLANGFTEDFARNVWEHIKTHGKFSFNKAHSVVYGYVTFYSQYCKQHFPSHFYLYHIIHEDKPLKKRRLMQEAAKRGYKILSPKFGVSKADWSIDEDGNLRAGLCEIPGVAVKTASIIADCNDPITKDQIPSSIPKRVRTIIEKNIQLVDEQEDFFNLIFDERISAHNGTKCYDIDWDDKTYSVDMAVSFFELNAKSYEEERKSRGQSTADTKSPELDRYCMLMAEDDTDSLMLQVNRFAYPRLQSVIWDAFTNKKPVRVQGQKIRGWRIVSVKNVEYL